MMIGSLVRYAQKSNSKWGKWFPSLTLAGDGTWKNPEPGVSDPVTETWYYGDVGLIVDITSRNHRKAILMRDNKFYEIALKHLEQVSKTSFEPKKLKQRKEQVDNGRL